MDYFSVIIDNNVWNLFIAFYNSYRHYEHQTPLKVYVVGALDSDRLEKLQTLCYTIVDPLLRKPSSWHKFQIKYVALQIYCADKEIILDVDTIFLNNLDWLFDCLDESKMIVAYETHASIAPGLYYDTSIWLENHSRAKLELQDILRANDLYWPSNQEHVFRGYNGGFVGITKNHLHLVNQLLTVLNSSWNCAICNNNEQYALTTLINVLQIPVHELPQETFMNTWERHGIKKEITVESGKFVVYQDSNQRLNFYHFTGGVSLKNSNGQEVKWSHLTIKDIEARQLWLEKYNNPVILLYYYFLSQGL